jgi:hypothetical protein
MTEGSDLVSIFITVRLQSWSESMIQLLVTPQQRYVVAPHNGFSSTPPQHANNGARQAQEGKGSIDPSVSGSTGSMTVTLHRIT